ncbi:MAG: toxin-antitoxin system YwqK family antitoxin [Mangrovibacterium sp.]
MNKYLIFSLTLLFACTFSQAQTINQTDANGLKQGTWGKFTSEGTPIYEGTFKDGKPIGTWKRYHSNGIIRAQLTYVENTDFCSVLLFDNTGKKIASGGYVNEQREGVWLFFRNMIKVCEEYYIDGKKTGNSATFYDTGELMSESNFANGTANGAYRAYNKDGSVYFECMMKDGMRDGYCQIFFDNGAVEIIGYYEKDIREKDWEYFHKDGSKAYTLHYKGGLVTNTAVLDSVSALRLKGMEKDGKHIADPEQFMDNPSQYMQILRNKQ